MVEEEIIQEAPMPVKIYGDIRGQFRDFLLLLLDFGFPSSSGPSFVFNGDWVTRPPARTSFELLTKEKKLILRSIIFQTWLLIDVGSCLSIPLLLIAFFCDRTKPSCLISLRRYG